LMLVMVVFFIAFRWIHLSTPLIRLFLLVLILLLMPTLNFLPVWFALSLLRFRLPSRLPMMFILWMVAMMVVIIPSRTVDRKSGSAGMPRPISYAVFCLKKKTTSIELFSHFCFLVTAILSISTLSLHDALPIFVSVGADIAFDADPKFFACLVRFESSSVPTTLPTAYDVYPLDGRHDGGYYTVKDC